MKLVRLKDKNANNIINKNQLELQYPVNKVEIFYDNLDHSNWLGFTWELIAQSRTLVGIDTNDTDFNTIGKTGGSKFLQEHYHTLSKGGQNFITSNGAYAGVCGDWGAWNTTGVQGVQTGNSGNLQPYEVVAYWRRIS